MTIGFRSPASKNGPTNGVIISLATTPNGDVYYVSLAGSYIGHINVTTGAVTLVDPPTPDQGARRIWSDSHGRLWISEWNVGKLAL
jgi:virginiamycin B lyase